MVRGRVLVVAVLGALLVAAAPAHGACKPKLSAKCLKQARGVETIDVRASGTIDRATAIQAFVQTVAPLPGVAVRPGAVGTLRSGSGPIRWLARYRRTLTPAQRKVYDQIRTGKRTGFRAKRRGRRARAAATPSAAIKAEWQQLLVDAVPRLEAKFAVKLDAKVTSTVSPTPAAGGDASADASFVGGTCHVNVYPEGWAEGLDVTSKRFLAAHEMTHCFQGRIAGKGIDGGDRAWLMEGSAQWAGAVVALEWSAATKISWGAYTGYYDRWLTHPEYRLFERTYSAVGFYGHLQRAGIDVWSRLRLAYTQDDAPAYTTMVGGDQGFLRSLASGFARESGLGPEWDTSGPSITPAKAPQPSHGLPDGETVAITANERAARLDRVLVTADVVELAADGGPYGRLRDSGGAEFPLEANAFCARSGGCACPPGSAGADLGSLPTLAPGSARVAAASYVDPVTVTVKGRSLDDFCASPGAKPRALSDLSTSGAVASRGTKEGSCRFGDGDFFAIFQMDGPPITDAAGTYPKAYYLQIFGKYTGPGVYTIDRRGETVWPRASFTDAMGTAWESVKMPGEDPVGSYTVNPDERSGTLQVTMLDGTGGTTVDATGRWRCTT